MKLVRRPLALACIFFVICAVAGYLAMSLGASLAVASGALASLVLIFYLIVNNRAKRAAFVCFLCALFSFLAFLSSYLYFGVKSSAAEEYYGREVTLEAVVTEAVYSRSYGGLYHIKTEKLDGEKISANLVLETEGARLSVNDTFTMKVILEPFSENINGYAEKMIKTGEGYICACVQSGEDFTVTGKREKNLISFIFDAREWTGKRFSDILDSRAAGLFTAAFAGDDSYVSDFDMQALRRSGTTHILAVSGTHFTVIMGAILLFLKLFGFPLIIRNILLCTVAVAYTAFTGFSPSVVRSAVMLLFTYLGSSVGKVRDLPTSLFLTMALMIGCAPYLVINAAFWLSSVATLGIILCIDVFSETFGFEHKVRLTDILRDGSIPVFRRILRFSGAVLKNWIKGLPMLILADVIVSLFAAAVAIPVSLIFFGNVSLVAIISGLIMSPVASVIIVAAPFVLILGEIPFVASVCRAASEFFYGTAHFFSDIDGVYINVDYTAVKIIVLLFIAVTLAVVLFSKTQKPLIAVCAVFVVAVVVGANISEAVIYNGFDAAYNSESDADSLCVRGNRGLVIADMGSASRSDIKAAISAASDLRENTVSAYVITDVKKKHVSLVRYLCSNYRVDTLYMPNYAAEDKAVLVAATQREALEFGVEVRLFNFGEEFTADGTCVQISELEYISRSSIPLYAVSIGSQNGRVSWVSKSYFERENTDFAYNLQSGVLIFGTYGARVKEENGADLDKLAADRFIIPTEEIYSSFSSEALDKMKRQGLNYTERIWIHTKKSR